MKKVNAGKKELNPLDIAIGWRVRTIRMQHKMSMAALGERIGVKYNQINKYEKGHDRINIERLHKIAQVFNVPVGYFFGDMEPDSQARLDQRMLAIAAEIENAPTVNIRRDLYALIRTINRDFENLQRNKAA